MEFPSVSTVIQSIQNAGGKAKLAHPGEIIKETDEAIFQKELLRLLDFGIDGIECYYPSHSSEITKLISIIKT